MIAYSDDYINTLEKLNRVEKYLKYLPKGIEFTVKDLKDNKNPLFDLFPDPENIIENNSYCSWKENIKIENCHKVDILLYILSYDLGLISVNNTIDRSKSRIGYPVYKALYYLREKPLCFDQGTYNPEETEWLLSHI